jgi:phosphatidylserine decarboxylase
MQNQGYIFAKEGHSWVYGSWIAFMVTLPFGKWWLTAPLALFSLFAMWFFRNPEREIPSAKDIYVSPADGRVLSIDDRFEESRYLHQTMKRLCIFMSPLDVHVNRVPRSGRVVEVIYHPGKFFSANKPKASLDNEQNAVIVKDEKGRVYMFVQIAGFIARRIICYARAGKDIEIGQRVGLIKFGSRLDVFLPLEAEISVSPGQKVKAGETVIGRLI